MCMGMAPVARPGLSLAEKYPRGSVSGRPLATPGAAQMYRVLYRERATGDGPAMDETMDKIIGASNSPSISMLCLG
jgi:hypothetical protein